MTAPAIETQNLTKEYPHGFLHLKRKTSLENLTMQVEDGEVFGFLGPNGAGKSTTIKLLMGIIFPTAGSAQILGKPVSDVSMHQDIGYLPEQPYFYDYLTAEELLGYFAGLFGYAAAERRSITTERLPRCHVAQPGWDRSGSPPGGSALTTLAPKSASSIVATAPAIPLLRSITRMS